jgi:hypothetical protein
MIFTDMFLPDVEKERRNLIPFPNRRAWAGKRAQVIACIF